MADIDQPKDEGVTIPGVEILRTGIWNNTPFTSTDLDDIVKAYAVAGYKPPVKLGHGQTDSDPAYGFVENLRREGEKLVADFVKVPSKLAQMIREARYNAVSSEVYFDLKRNGRAFRRLLKAVAVVGADVPAVSDLKPLSEISFGECEFSRVLALTDYQEPKTEKAVEMKTLKDAQAALDKAIDEGNAEAIRAASARVVEFTAQEAAEKAKQDTAGDDKAALEVLSLKQEIQELKEKTKADREETRQRWLDSEVQNVIPVVRPHVRAFLDLASTDENKVRKFTVGEGDDAKDVGAMSLAEDMIKRLAKVGTYLTTDHAMTGQETKQETRKLASDEVHERAVKLTQEDTKLDYDAAIARVLQSDAALKERYAAEIN